MKYDTKQSIMNEIGEKISDIRWSLKLRQNQFVEAFNATSPKDITMTPNDLSRYESGTNVIPIDKYLKLLSMATAP